MTTTLDTLRDHMHDLERTTASGWPEDIVAVAERMRAELATFAGHYAARGASIGSDPDIATDRPDPADCRADRAERFAGCGSPDADHPLCGCCPDNHTPDCPGEG